ncbi:glycosyltransferase family 2 protein [Paenibacillus sp. KS-LC4]|uniref:tetratricopeptide repeat-containing glycosyltransferase family 2 protein n=1 Tax=Paenibacillus sp. KS-LC4 TaxID=2979727 RepID=UPI0030D3A723
MISISLCMIVKNEEDTLGRCLSSIHDLVDEIIIVDTGSTDRTKFIASNYTELIFDREWTDDFAAARNYAFSKAGKDYIFWLDADDMLLENDREKLAILKAELSPEVDSVRMNYHLAFDEYGNLTSSISRNRLVKRVNNYRWIGAVHEYLEVWGNIESSDIAVIHNSLHHDRNRNLMIYEKRLERGETFTPRDLYYYANELRDHGKYEQAILHYEKFLSTGEGWVEDNAATCGKLADCYNQLGDAERELESILRSFQYGSPRAEFCCRLGYYFLQQKDFETAGYWYNLAIERGQSDQRLGFVNVACSTWLPHLQLCVCYDRLGDYEQAYRHNEAARAFRPDDPRVLQNKAYLESLQVQAE